jgi:chromosome segregation ATPase
MSYPTPGASDLAQAKTCLDSLKRSFASTWQDTERTLEFLMQIIQRQTQHIETLQEHANVLDRQNQEKSHMINSLEAQRAVLEGSVAEKQGVLVQVINENHKLKMGLARGLSRFQELQNKMGGMEANYQSAASEVATLRIKLDEAEERAQLASATSKQTQGNQQSSGLTNEQWKHLEVALKRELEVRNGVGTLGGHI